MKWFKFNDCEETVINLESVECVQANTKFDFDIDSFIHEITVKTKSGNSYVISYSKVFEDDFTKDFERLYKIFE